MRRDVRRGTCTRLDPFRESAKGAPRVYSYRYPGLGRAVSDMALPATGLFAAPGEAVTSIEDRTSSAYSSRLVPGVE